jgi:hypothetical protein
VEPEQGIRRVQCGTEFMYQCLDMRGGFQRFDQHDIRIRREPLASRNARASSLQQCSRARKCSGRGRWCEGLTTRYRWMAMTVFCLLQVLVSTAKHRQSWYLRILQIAASPSFFMTEIERQGTQSHILSIIAWTLKLVRAWKIVIRTWILNIKLMVRDTKYQTVCCRNFVLPVASFTYTEWLWAWNLRIGLPSMTVFCLLQVLVSTAKHRQSWHLRILEYFT